MEEAAMVESLKGMKDMDKTVKRFTAMRDNLDKTDGKTKKRVDEWNANLKVFKEKNKDQVDLLEAIKRGQASGMGGGGSSTQDYFRMMVERMAKDIEDLIKICQQVTTLNMKKAVLSKDQNDQDWAIARQTIRNEAINALSMSTQPNANKLQIISKMMNMRDNLNMQIFRSCLYKKMILWDDLNIQCEEWCHEKVVECNNRIQKYADQLKYKPTKLEFEDVNLDIPGFFNFGDNSETCESTNNMSAFIESIMDMEQLIKKNFIGYSDSADQEKLVQNPVQKTLREEFEVVKQELSDFQQKYKDLVISRNKDSESSNQFDMQTQIDNLQREVQMKGIQLEEQKKKITNMDSHAIVQRTKLREAEEKVTKLEGHMLPKLKETVTRQKDMKSELEKIYLDAQLLPNMFKAEALFRKECSKEKDQAVEEMTKALKQHNKLVKKIDDLENELARKTRLSIQAIAARSSIKLHLDESKSQNIHLNNVIEELKQKVVDADNMTAEYKRKHDEMFDSVSGLNKRIDELEEHKLHLFKKLESYGERSDLSYIVKTQKLDQMKPKEPANPIKVDPDYDPGKNRNEQDKENDQMELNAANN